jgi:hypothetical protein
LKTTILNVIMMTAMRLLLIPKMIQRELKSQDRIFISVNGTHHTKYEIIQASRVTRISVSTL